MTQSTIPVNEIKDRAVSAAFDAVGTIFEGPLPGIVVKNTSNGAGVYPASATYGWAITNNFGSTEEVDFWNLSQASSAQFGWQWKTGAASLQNLAILYTDGTTATEFDVNSPDGSTVFLNAGNGTTGGFLGTPTPLALTFQTNNTSRLVIDSAGGIYTLNASGGSKGLGTLNLEASLYNNGVAPTGSGGGYVLATAPSISSLTVISAFTATGLVTNADLTTYAHTQKSVAAPTGTGDIITGRMMGLAGTITPTSSGTVRISVVGDIANSTLAKGANIQLRTGTGAAPVNGDPTTGTARGSIIKHICPVAATTFPFALNWTITGLALNTAIWIDVNLTCVTSGTASIADVDIVADEIP